MDFDIFALTPGGGGHVLTVHQASKDMGTRLVVIAGESVLCERAEAMMERLMGEPIYTAPLTDQFSEGGASRGM